MKGYCLACGKEFEIIGEMVDHTVKTGHQWYRIGEEKVIKVVVYIDEMEAKEREIKAENRGYNSGWEDAIRNGAGEDEDE